MGPGARGEGTEEEVFTVVVSLSVRLRNLAPCSRGPRGTSISPRDLPACVTDAAERGRHAREGLGEESRKKATATAREVGEKPGRCRRRRRCWLVGDVIFSRSKLGDRSALPSEDKFRVSCKDYDRKCLLGASEGEKGVSFGRERERERGADCRRIPDAVDAGAVKDDASGEEETHQKPKIRKTKEKAPRF